jgi:NDP-sugar pyrophosphorylase family protein
MKAMILAAGLGTRLRPLTDTRPKALVEINNRTLLEITLTRLRTFGVTEAIVNVHHFADMVALYLKSKNNFGMRIEISREDDQLLDTGGGLKKAAWFFQENSPLSSSSSKTSVVSDEPFVLHNADVLSTIDLTAMLQFHVEHQALATLAVQSRPSSRQLLFNDQLQLSGRRISGQDSVILSGAKNPGTHVSQPANLETTKSSSDSPLAYPEPRGATRLPRAPRGHSFTPSPEGPLPPSKEPSPLLPLAFSGIHILSPHLLPQLTETGPFSIIDSYLRLSSQGQKILAFRHDHSYWRDLGKPADLAQAALDLQKNIFS